MIFQKGTLNFNILFYLKGSVQTIYIDSLLIVVSLVPNRGFGGDTLFRKIVYAAINNNYSHICVH